MSEWKRLITFNNVYGYYAAKLPPSCTLTRTQQQQEYFMRLIGRILSPRVRLSHICGSNECDQSRRERVCITASESDCRAATVMGLQLGVPVFISDVTDGPSAQYRDESILQSTLQCIIQSLKHCNVKFKWYSERY